MAMQNRKALLIVSFILIASVVATLSARHSFAKYVYPGSTIILERSADNNFWIAYMTGDSLDGVLKWFEREFSRYDRYQDREVKNTKLLCHSKQWGSKNLDVTAIICNQGDYRTVSVIGVHRVPD